MLTLNLKDFKIDINNYNNFVANLEVKTLVCPNCKACDYERHGYYKRYINISGTKYYIRILRVRCKACGKTHAVLPDFIVPYLHEPILSLLELVVKPVRGLDYYYAKLKNKILSKWKPILRSLGVTLEHELKELVILCSAKLKMCFMQIHRGKYFCK